jgi:hypothetical protein
MFAVHQLYAVRNTLRAMGNGQWAINCASELMVELVTRRT